MEQQLSALRLGLLAALFLLPDGKMRQQQDTQQSICCLR